jgi:signal transduction histidine kinase
MSTPPQLDENGLDAARRISRAARQIEILVRDLLAYSKLSQEEIKLERVELEDLARETLELMKADISERGARSAWTRRSRPSGRTASRSARW